MTLRCALIACLLLATGLGAQDLLLRGGRVITVSGPELPRADVWVQGGRIAAVGEDLAVPPEVPTHVVRGLTVMPGFVVGHTSGGLDLANEQVPVTPYVSVLDSLDPSSTYFEDSLRDGHLTLLVLPGDRTIIGGLGRVVQPRGLTVEDMTLVPDAGMKISLIPPSGTRASHLAKLRSALDDGLRHWREVREKNLDRKESGNLAIDLAAFQADKRKAALVRMLKGEIPAYIACGTAADVERALELIDQYKLQGRLVCHPPCFRAARLLGSRKDVPVLLVGALEHADRDPDTGEDIVRIVPKELHAAGVRFGVSHQPGALGPRYLWYQAASLVRYGMTRSEALAAVTLVPAEFARVADRKGSLDSGKDADLLVLSDDPLSGRAWVEEAYIQGVKVYERRRDPRLRGLFEGASR
jgi:imidazolonepropionase-like amidohydrolase